jgi:hypothetical protein
MHRSADKINIMFRMAGFHRFTTLKGNVGCCSRIISSITHNRLRRSTCPIAIHAQLSNSAQRIQQPHHISHHNTQPVVSLNFLNMAASTSCSISTTNSVCDSSSDVSCLDLECISIDGDDDG